MAAEKLHPVDPSPLKAYTLSVTQSGQTASATLTGPSFGQSCSYSGNVRATDFSLSVVSCTKSDTVGAQCPGSGAPRAIRLPSASIGATVNGNSMNGTLSETYRLEVPGTSTVAGMATISSLFTLTKQ
jgi:hypothetical protein